MTEEIKIGEVIDFGFGPPKRATCITLNMGPGVSDVVYQWQGNDNKPYSPVFDTTSEAFDYQGKFPLVPMVGLEITIPPAETREANLTKRNS